MFAVPGWSLSAPAVQSADSTSASKSSKKKKKSTTSTGANDIPLKPRGLSDERKKAEMAEHKARSEAGKRRALLEKVKPENVAEMWESVIEGKKGPDGGETGQGKKRKRGKKEKSDKNEGKKVKTGVEAGAEEKEESATTTETQKKKEKRAKKSDSTDSTATAAPGPPQVVTALTSLPALTPLQQKMRAKLSSARFRHINETLYTTPSASSLSLFTTDPSMYHEYHTGFRQQVEVWPENPVDIFISHLRTRGPIAYQKGHTRKHLPSSTALLPLPRDLQTGVCTVADLGCGDAKIAGTFNHGKEGKKLKIQVKSFDLQASTPDVTVADIANLPLEKESVDITIFCLALMGTNFLDFIDEAYRILRWRGELWVAEIKSRFQRKAEGPSNQIGQKKKAKKADEDEEEPEDAELVEGEIAKRKEEAVYKSFVDALEKRGFKLRGTVDAGNKMFVRMEFVKMPEKEKRRLEEEEEGEEGKFGKGKKIQKDKKKKFIEDKELTEKDILKPCVYKL
ncbi:hypothetical protein EX30DRAFT_337469, partial [Ascodesmis nigricans]